MKYKVTKILLCITICTGNMLFSVDTPFKMSPIKHFFETEEGSHGAAERAGHNGYRASCHELVDEQGRVIYKIPLSSGCLQLSEDNNFIAYKSEEKEPTTIVIPVASLKKDKLAKFMVKGSSPIFSAQSKYIVTSVNEGTAQKPKEYAYIYDVPNLTNESSGVVKVEGKYPFFSPDEKFIVTSMSDVPRGPILRINIYRAESGKLLATIPGEAPTFSPNSEFIVTYNANQVYKATGDAPGYYVYNLATGKTVQKWIKGNESSVMEKPKFSPDSQLLFTQSFFPKNETYVYDVKTGSYLFDLEGNEASIDLDNKIISTSIHRAKKPTEVFNYDLQDVLSKYQEWLANTQL